MLVRDLGERAAIARLVAGVPTTRNILGFRDDCAAIPLGDGSLLVASTDACARATHFPDAMTPAMMGSYACEVALSDVAAMGAEAIGVLLAVGLPPDTPADFLDGFREGVIANVTRAGCELLGGDLKENPELTVAATALGRVEESNLLTRAGARAGDLAAVTGTLGGAGAGMEALAGRLPAAFLARLLEPRARLAAGRALALSGAARAAMDLSDGLGQALHAVCDESGVGVEIDDPSLPVDPLAVEGAARLGDGSLALAWAIERGGDFELLVALDAATGPAVAERLGLTLVGRFTPAEEGRRLADGTPLPRAGHEHFRPRA